MEAEEKSSSASVVFHEGTACVMVIEISRVGNSHVLYGRKPNGGTFGVPLPSMRANAEDIMLTFL